MEFESKVVRLRGIVWTGENFPEIREFCNGLARMTRSNGNGEYLVIETREGSSRASIGDTIMQGTMGEFYPVKPDVMEAKYHPGVEVQ
ncbi:hypothetical protein [Streptomyces sp. CoH17]|uniref:hypothetical protein n=1 Tax=Streptomyces sp. CoH17 TaxID=2992806 RepID=UPI00226ECA5B|nr:hypothetical protein [Streptomyces sp. CoH17]